jgi:hypothetical protein
LNSTIHPSVEPIGNRNRDTNGGVSWKHWIFPGIVVFVLLGIGVVDLYQTVTTPKPTGVDVFADGEMWFEPRNRLIDLRSEPASTGDVPVKPVHDLTAGWAESEPGGTWTDGPRAELKLRLTEGGQRAVLLQCRPDPARGAPPLLRLTVNGVACEPVRLNRTASVRRIELPEGVMVPGDNVFELLLIRRGSGGRPADGRRLLVRRMVLADRADADFSSIAFRRPVSLHPDQSMAVIRAPGRLLFVFDVKRPGGYLMVECGFRGRAPVDGCSMGAARWFGETAGMDAIGVRRVSFEDARQHRVQRHLGNHAGQAVLWIETSSAAVGSEVVVTSPRVVFENG